MLTASATRRAAIAAAAGALAAPTLAQSGRVIRLIVPFSAGGNTDVLVRVVGRTKHYDTATRKTAGSLVAFLRTP